MPLARLLLFPHQTLNHFHLVTPTHSPSHTQDEFYDVNTHARSLEKALEAAGRPHLVITPMLHSHGCDIGSTVPFQFLRFALTKFLRAVKDSTGA